MNVFLSGKVDPVHGAWRDAILGLDHVWDKEQGRLVGRSRWRLDYDESKDTGASPTWQPWPTERNAWVLGHHTYIGPYRQDWPAGDPSWYGEAHGNITRGQHGYVDDGDRDARQITTACIQRIRAADMVFAYINTPDAFGTLAEIGLARGMGKFVYLLVHPDACWDSGDYWFVSDLAAIAGQAGYWQYDMDEQMNVIRHLREAFVAFSALGWLTTDQVARGARYPQPPAASASPPWLEDVIASFGTIAQWSADPRVRDEARRMMGFLAGSQRGNRSVVFVKPPDNP